MKVALTGANGFLGRYVLAALRDRNIETVTVGRKRVQGHSEAGFVERDLLAIQDFHPLMESLSATHLLHLAWYTDHGAFWTSPLNQRWVEATNHLVQAFCEAGGQGVVGAGTCAEYDWSHGLCQEEKTPLLPKTAYGQAKACACSQAMAVCGRYEVPCAWGRVFLPFGKGEDRRRLIPSLVDAFRGERVAFAVNQSAGRDFLHASDVAEGFATLLVAGASGAYNISKGEPTALESVVREIARLLNADPQAILGLKASRPEEPPMVVGENLKLRGLGWQPRLTLTEGLERTLNGRVN